MTILDTLKPGQTIYTVTRHVTQSGMGRWISLFIVDSDGNVRDLTYALTYDPRTAEYFTTRGSKHEGVYVGGCGMDMGHWLVYSLGRVLYPQGVPCSGGRECPSNDHANPPYPGPDATVIHSDGGYAFNQVWL